MPAADRHNTHVHTTHIHMAHILHSARSLRIGFNDSPVWTAMTRWKVGGAVVASGALVAISRCVGKSQHEATCTSHEQTHETYTISKETYCSAGIASKSASMSKTGHDVAAWNSQVTKENVF